MIEGVWWAKKEKKPCVMTIYNWRRKGIYPRLLAWRWAVIRADRRWYISEFVWDSWEKKRRKGSARLPVVSRMPQKKHPPTKERIFIYWQVGTQKGIRVLLKAYARLGADPREWPLIMLGDIACGKKFCIRFRKKGYKVYKYLGL